jgi:hypothetical protein
VLFLPALWQHHVEQEEDGTGRVIGVNAWYDLRVDLRWVHTQLSLALAQDAGLADALGGTGAAGGGGE